MYIHIAHSVYIGYDVDVVRNVCNVDTVCIADISAFTKHLQSRDHAKHPDRLSPNPFSRLLRMLENLARPNNLCKI